MNPSPAPRIIRRAVRADLEAVRGLLPQLFKRKTRSAVLVGEWGGRIVAAVSLGRVPGEPEVARFNFASLGDFHLRLGPSLVRAAGIMAHKQGAKTLITESALEPGSATEQFLLRVGFLRGLELVKFELEVAAIQKRLAPLLRRGEAQLKNEALRGLRLVRGIPEPEKTALLLKRFFGAVGAVNLEEAPSIACVSLLVGDAVVGFLSGRTNPPVASVEVICLDPTWRQSPAGMLLRSEWLRLVAEDGVRTLQFSANRERHFDTVRMAEKSGGRAVGFRYFYTKPVLPPAVRTS